MYRYTRKIDRPEVEAYFIMRHKENEAYLKLARLENIEEKIGVDLIDFLNKNINDLEMLNICYCYLKNEKLSDEGKTKLKEWLENE